VILGLLVTATSATAQDEPTDLAARCEANAPDAATLATCLEIVATVLEPAGGTFDATVGPTPLAALLYGAEAIVGETTFDTGAWTAFDGQGKRPKVGSKDWKAVAASTADGLGTFLLTVRPESCYEDIYLDVWSAYGAFKLAGAGAKSGDRLIDDALTELFSGMFDFPPECGPGWSPDGPQ
jgi:hypothetical protein